MDDPWPKGTSDPRQIPAMMEEGVDEGPGGMARRRMDDQASGLIEDEEVLVFEEYVEGYGLGVGADGAWGREEGDHPISGADRCPRLDLPPVQADKTF